MDDTEAVLEKDIISNFPNEVNNAEDFLEFKDDFVITYTNLDSTSNCNKLSNTSLTISSSIKTENTTKSIKLAKTIISE